MSDSRVHWLWIVSLVPFFGFMSCSPDRSGQPDWELPALAVQKSSGETKSAHDVFSLSTSDLLIIGESKATSLEIETTCVFDKQRFQQKWERPYQSKIAVYEIVPEKVWFNSKRRVENVGCHFVVRGVSADGSKRSRQISPAFVNSAGEVPVIAIRQGSQNLAGELPEIEEKDISRTFAHVPPEIQGQTQLLCEWLSIPSSNVDPVHSLSQFDFSNFIRRGTLADNFRSARAHQICKVIRRQHGSIVAFSPYFLLKFIPQKLITFSSWPDVKSVNLRYNQPLQIGEISLLNPYVHNVFVSIPKQLSVNAKYIFADGYALVSRPLLVKLPADWIRFEDAQVWVLEIPPKQILRLNPTLSGFVANCEGRTSQGMQIELGSQNLTIEQLPEVPVLHTLDPKPFATYKVTPDTIIEINYGTALPSSVKAQGERKQNCRVY